MSGTLKVGIIGAGGIMRGAHMPGWQLAKDVEVVAVCDVLPEAAHSFAEQFGIDSAHVYTDFNELVRHPDLDLVDIATPNIFHPPAVLAALEQGLHVMCEKPLAVRTADVREMGAAARAAGKLLMTAQNHRWSPSAVAIKRFVDDGSVGDVYYARIHAVRRNWLPARRNFTDVSISGGGPCMDIGVHALDLGMWLMGSPNPVRVSGVSRVNFAKGDVIPGGWGEWDRESFSVEDFAAGFVHFDNGATLVLESCWLQHQQMNEDFSAQLFGTGASVQWPSGAYASTANRALLTGTIEPERMPHQQHKGEILAFVDAIRSGGPSPVPVEETIKVIAILEALMESSRLGREVEIDPASLTIPETVIA